MELTITTAVVGATTKATMQVVTRTQVAKVATMEAEIVLTLLCPLPALLDPLRATHLLLVTMRRHQQRLLPQMDRIFNRFDNADQCE